MLLRTAKVSSCRMLSSKKNVKERSAPFAGFARHKHQPSPCCSYFAGAHVRLVHGVVRYSKHRHPLSTAEFHMPVPALSNVWACAARRSQSVLVQGLSHQTIVNKYIHSWSINKVICINIEYVYFSVFCLRRVVGIEIRRGHGPRRCLTGGWQRQPRP